MKRSTLILAVTIQALAASASFSQVMPIRAIAPINPIAGLPKLLPSPMSGPLTGMGISLPTVLPTLAPSPALLAAAAPAPSPVSFPAILPSRAPSLPVPANPSHENVINPLRRVLPGVAIRFADAPKADKKPDAAKDNLDQLFDGEDAPIKPGIGRGVVGNERRISLPEDDLMRELGF